MPQGFYYVIPTGSQLTVPAMAYRHGGHTAIALFNQ